MGFCISFRFPVSHHISSVICEFVYAVEILGFGAAGWGVAGCNPAVGVGAYRQY